MCSIQHTRIIFPDHKPKGLTFDSTIMTVMTGSTSEYSLTLTSATGLKWERLTDMTGCHSETCALECFLQLNSAQPSFNVSEEVSLEPRSSTKRSINCSECVCVFFIKSPDGRAYVWLKSQETLPSRATLAKLPVGLKGETDKPYANICSVCVCV